MSVDDTNTDSLHGDIVVSDELLAEFERQTELGSSLSDGDCQSAIGKEHQRCFAIVESLSLPIRKAIIDEPPPPCLQEYCALEEIGRGGMGIVYRAKHHKTQRIDAIKIIRPDRLTGDSSAEVRQMQLRFEREARLAARVSHEQIVPIYQVGDVDGCLWFSMLFVEGASLHDLICSKAISLEVGVFILERISRAIDVVHRHGILHGDIKPQNILVERETNRPLITDFGLAEFVHGVNDMQACVAGTLAYMAPELVDAAQNNKSPEEVAAIRSVASDIYSLGATLICVLTANTLTTDQFNVAKPSPNTLGHQSRFTSEHFEKMPAPLARICRKCVSDDPNARYATACDLADELAIWLERPSWNQFFPDLRYLLWMVVAPSLGLSGLAVWFLLHFNAPEFAVWIAMFAGYLPLFATFLTGQRVHRESNRARRELWSIWLGHMVGSVACMIAVRILAPDLNSAVTLFYPCCAAISSVTFFAKSGNFWLAYRWFGLLWAGATVALAAVPDYNAILFGGFAVITCATIARCDKSFLEK